MYIMAMYILAAICVVFGFIALLKQKTYLDSNTNEPISVDVPLFGNMKTNYPSLVFLFVGAVLAVIPWVKTPPVPPPPPVAEQEQWVITGAFTAPKGVTVKWWKGTLAPLPQGFDCVVKPNGTFILQYPVPKGKRIEEFVKTLCYTNGTVSKTIDTANEYAKWLRKEDSLIENTGATTVNYKPVEVEPYQEN